jgi:hypothetical protein
MLRVRRFPRKTALVLAVLTAVLFSLPHDAHAVAGRAALGQAASGQAASGQAGPGQAGPGQPAPGQPIAAQTLAARSPAASGGLCSVPGIGDIGGLLGFCSLGQSGLTGDLNSICEPSVPDPEPANSGIDSLVRPPSTPGPVIATPYNQYGVAGMNWAATNLQCSDMTSLIGNSVAGMLFDVAKSIDRVTITVYQSAASDGILSWLRNVADKLITSLGNAIYFPYLAVVVIIGAIWLAWQGLIRKRGTRTIEGTVWMVVACAAAIWLIGRPADFTGIGTGVSDGITTTLNAAFAKLPSPGQDSCMPVQQGDPQIQPASYSYTSGNTVVDQNANELWTVLVCKPWLDGELGTTAFSAPGGKPTPVNTYARQLLWAQAIAANEKPTTGLIQAKQATYTGIAQSIQQNNPGIYPLFQGKEWTTRLEIAFAALLAAVVAGVLVLLISVTLILLKLGFLLLLIVGPFFLLIGTHPGFGRLVAVRWFEMLVGVLLKQAAVALVLSVLLYCYALIMGTSDAVLPWALKILMIALVTIAAFIYRRPFQHLFSAAGYGMIGSSERAEVDLRRAGSTLRANPLSAATVAVPGFAAYRAARWARRNPSQAAGPALGAASVGGGSAVAAGAAGTDGVASADGLAGQAAADGNGLAGGNGAADGTNAAGRAGLGSRVRAWGASAGDGAGRDAPPLNLPARQASLHVPSGWTRSSEATPAGPAPGVGPARAAGPAPGVGARSPARAAGPAPAGGPAGAGGPARGAGAGPSSGASAAPRPAAAPAARSGGSTAPGSSGPWSGAARPAGSPAARPAGPPAGPAPASPAGPPPGRAPAAGAPASRAPGPFAPRPADLPPNYREGPPPARQPGSRGGPPAPRAAQSPRSAQSARPAGNRGGAGTGTGARPGDHGDPAAPPLAGGSGGDRPEAPVPFWLRPIRRRK